MLTALKLPARYDPNLTELGSGAFGRVYRTFDSELGIPVAIKIPHRAGEGDLAREVMVELRAAAALRHPGFIQVLDVSFESPTQPYLVMEFADGGSMERLVVDESTSWDDLVPLLDGVLEALAYAHARGLVHRDIKPENILLQRGSRNAIQPKLADFGLAKVLMRRGYGSTRLGAGTIPYMPPEAFDSDASGIHPGADLYAFGVLLYRLLSGRYPWDLLDISVILAKVEGRHRPLQPRPGLVCPPHVGGVIDRLLQPRPGLRYALAADVREALLGGGGAWGSAPARPHTSFAEDSAQPGRSGRSIPDRVPDLGAPPGPPPTPTIAVQREPLLVDRDGERAHLWGLVRQAAERPLGVVLAGPAGGGRSRLCRWVTTTLEEIGLARTLHVRIDGAASPTGAAGSALRRFLAVHDLAGAALRKGLATWFLVRGHQCEEDIDSLCGWLEPGGQVSSVPLLDPQQAAARRIAVLELTLRLESRRGLVCVWLEEEAPDGSAAEFAVELLRRATGDPYPLMVLYEAAGGTEPSSTLSGQPLLQVGPLSDPDMASLVADLTVGSGRAPAIISRAQGIPLRAVESARLLCTTRRMGPENAWDAEVSATLLVSGEDGDLAELATTFAPVRVGLARLQSFCSAASGQADRSARGLLVGLLSLLPGPCPEGLLENAWLAAGGGPWDRGRVQIDEARCGGLLVREEHGALHFAGGALARAAREQVDGRSDIAELRRACAGVLLSSTSPAQGTLRHAAGLLGAAGSPGAALEILIPLAQILLAHDSDAAARVWGEAEEIVSAAELAVTDPRRVQVALGSARAARQMGEVRRAEEHLDAVVPATLEADQRAEWHEIRAAVLLLKADLPQARREAGLAIDDFGAAGEPVGVARARLLAADVLARTGLREEAVAVFEQAQAEAGAAGAVREELWARWLLARCLRGTSDRSRAGRELEGVLSLARRHGVAALEGGALRELGNLALLEGRIEEAEAPLRESIERLEAAGLRAEGAVTRISLGELARARGALVPARTEYAAALAVTRAYGLTSEQLAALINLGITELALSRIRSARRRLSELDGLLPPGVPHGARMHIEALRLAVEVAEGQWSAAEETLEGILATDPGLPAERDLLWLLEEAAAGALAAGEVPLAGDAWAAAAKVARALGDDVALDRIHEGLRRFG